MIKMSIKLRYVKTSMAQICLRSNFLVAIFLGLIVFSGVVSSASVQAATTTGVKQPFEFYVERGKYFSGQVNLHVAKAKKAATKKDEKTKCKELEIARDNAYYYSIIAVDAENFYPTGEQGDLGRSMVELSDEFRKWTAGLLAEGCPPIAR